MTTIKDGVDKENFFAQLCEMNHVRPDRRLFTIHNEFRQIQTKFFSMFSPYSILEFRKRIEIRGI